MSIPTSASPAIRRIRRSRSSPAATRIRPPVCWDDHGHDLLPDLLAHKYVGDFEILPFKGFTKPHSIELDLGDAYRGGPLRLLLHGEIEYFTATGMYAADQAGHQSQSRPTSKPRMQKGSGSVSSKTWDFPQDCRAP